MTGDGTIKVMVVDGQPLFAEALALAINASARASCVAIAPGAEEALHRARETRPDVAIIDAGVVTEGIAATQTLRATQPDLRVLVLTGRAPDASLVREAARAGASALLPKTASLRVVVESIPSLTEGCFTMDRRTVELLCAAAPGRAARSHGADGQLTGREQDILGLLVSGVDLQRASARLGITVNTARGYVKNLYRKLGVHNQLELLAVTRDRGLLDDLG